MKTTLALTICFFTWSAVPLRGFDYSTVVDPNVVVTGIRSDSLDQGISSVVITASYNSGGGNTVAAVYKGSLAGATSPSAVWNQLIPVFSGQSVTSSTLYGPNTAVFTPSLGAGNIIAVGSFMASVRVLPDGSFSDATWTNITIPGAPVTTGNTVIGDYVLGFAPTGTSNSYVATIPEPSTWGLLGLGAAMAAIIRQRRLRTA